MKMIALRNYFLLSGLIGALIFVGSCSDDEGGTPAPTISASPATISALPGEEVSITLTITSQTGATVSGTDGTNSVTVDSANMATYEVDALPGETITLTFTVTDVGGSSSATTVITVGDDGVERDAAALIAHLTTNMNVISDPSIAGLSHSLDGGLDPRASGSDVTANLATVPAGYVTTTYKGAFDPAAALWTDGWTALWEKGHTGTAASPPTGTKPVIDVNPIGGNLDADVTWTADNIYLLDGLVFVTNNATLTIEAGTVIKAKSTPTTSDNTSALVVTRGAKIMAMGTSSSPIVFTTDADDLNPVTLDWSDTNLWGGVILLGNAQVSKNGSEGQIEGIPTADVRGTYGGSDDTDNSGVIQYVSIRHSGIALSPGDEIQGLTLGGVGSGTTIDHVEIYGSADDGIEFFGGTVVLNYIAVAGAEDDSFDWDEGYRGGGQFWFAIQRSDDGDHGCECDGSVPDSGVPQSKPTVFNATYLGSGPSGGGGMLSMVMRDNTGGTYGNSIFTDFPDGAKGIEVEDLPDDSGDDSYLKIGTDINLLNNIWFVGGKTALDASSDGIIQVTGS